MADENIKAGGEEQAPADNQNQGQDPAAETPKDTAAGDQGSGNEAPKGEESSDDALAYDLKAPEGVEIAEDELQGIADTAKELGLSNDQAQALVNLKTQWQGEASDKAETNLSNLVQSWRDEIQSDKDFGGEKFEESMQDIKRVMDAFADDGLKSALDETGFGNHPQLFRFVAKIGRTMREDVHITGSPSSAPKTLADVLYGNQEG